MAAGNDVRIEFLASALGFIAERAPDEALEDEAAAAAFVHEARCALRHDAVLLCGSWPHWRIVTGTQGNLGRLPLPGLSDAEPTCDGAGAARLYILRPAGRALTRCEAIQGALRFGASVASGACSDGGYASGTQFYDTWLAAVARRQICPKCEGHGWHCAERTANRVRAMQLCAARFLNRAKAFLPRLRRNDQADRAARAYGAMARALAPYATKGYLARVWDDPGEQDRYAGGMDGVRRLHDVAARRLSELVVGI